MLSTSHRRKLNLAMLLPLIGGFCGVSGLSACRTANSAQLKDATAAGAQATGAHRTAVATRQYDNARTGANLEETTLNPDSVGSGNFHKLFTMPVDDQIEIYPLYVADVGTANGQKNLIFTATMNNTVFAFDADNGSPVWQQTLGQPVTGRDFAKVKPKTVNKNYGVASTPVIDTETGLLYLVRWGMENGAPVYRLFVLDIKNGSIRSNVKIQAQVQVQGANGGTVTAQFDPPQQIVRASLLLIQAPRDDGGTDKVVVMAAAGGEDRHSAHGWVLAYNTKDLESGNATPAAFCTSPATGAAGVWMAAQGIAGGNDGTLYVTTGNGPFDGVTDFGESFLRLRYHSANDSAPASLELAGSFTPFRDVDRDSRHQDQDLGSASPLLIPNTDLVVGGGKDGILYTMNRSDMGGRDFNKLAQAPFVATYVPNSGFDPVKNLDQGSSHDPEFKSPADNGQIHHLHSTPSFWTSPELGSLLFVWGENARLRVFGFDGRQFSSQALAFGDAIPSKKATGIGGMPGGLISISANGNETHSGIVWAEHAIDLDANKVVCPGIVRAYDADHFRTNADGTKTIVELWNSEMTPSDSLGNGAKFTAPMVVNGRVYVPTYDKKIVVYGLTQ